MLRFRDKFNTILKIPDVFGSQIFLYKKMIYIFYIKFVCILKPEFVYIAYYLINQIPLSLELVFEYN